MSFIFFIKAIQFFLSLSIIVILHELGHYIPARIFNTRVERFFLFFDVKYALFKKKIGETVYGVGWLPLGGYVKIAGMIDESMDTEQMKKPPQPWEFRSKPTWQRLIIMLGGIIVNLLLGFLIFMMMFFVWGKNTLPNSSIPLGLGVSKLAEEVGFEKGDQILKVDGKVIDIPTSLSKKFFLENVNEVEVLRSNGRKEVLTIPGDIDERMFQSGEMDLFYVRTPALIDSILPNSPAEISGLQVGDKIKSINNTIITDWGDLNKWKTENDLREFDLTIERRRSEKTLKIKLGEQSIIGVFPKPIELKNVSLSLFQSISEGYNYAYSTLYGYVASFKFVFTKKGAQQLGGFGTIGGLFPSEWDWRGFWSTTAFISIILAFMNLLPIPALDGGHVMFLIYEMITGRKPADKFLEYATTLGFILLLALVLYANGNDIYRAITQ